MTTQLELMRILNATNNFYETPGTRTWETAVTSHAVLFYDDNRNIDFIFELNPETFTIKMWAVQNQHKITVFTPTITLGSSRIAPDIILALHTLFEFDFASDATFVVQNAWISKLPATRPKHRRQSASDATAAVHSPSSSSSSASSHQSDFQPGSTSVDCVSSSVVSSSTHGSTSVDSMASSRHVRLLKRLLFLRP